MFIPMLLKSSNSDILQVPCFFVFCSDDWYIAVSLSATRWWSLIACSNRWSVSICKHMGHKETVTLVLSIKPFCFYHVTLYVTATVNWGILLKTVSNKQSNSKLTKIAFDVDLERYFFKHLFFYLKFPYVPLEYHLVWQV